MSRMLVAGLLLFSSAAMATEQPKQIHNSIHSNPGVSASATGLGFASTSGTLIGAPVSVGGSTTKLTVPPALSGLVGTQCMGSVSVSGGAFGVGVGLGSTWNDEQCQLRENIKTILPLDPALAQEMTSDLFGASAAQQRLITKGLR